jgi:Outer membrane protein beta-barrel domain
MSKNFTIDTVFKNQLSEMELDNADAMWQRMEAKLVQQKEQQDRKRYLLFMLLLIPVAAGLMITAGKKNEDAVGPVTLISKLKSKRINNYNTAAIPAAEKPGNINSDNGDVPGLVVSYCPQETGWYEKGVFVPGEKKILTSITSVEASTININDGDESNETANTETSSSLVSDRTAAERKMVIPAAFAQPGLLPAKKILIAESKAKETAAENRARKKILLSVNAGTDLVGKLQSNGKYAMALLHIPLNKSSSIELGAGISSHSTSQSYIVSEKQATLNREIDAKLRGLTMLQLPILYRQKIGGTRFQAKAGLTPVYITNASVTNVPNSFVGVVIPYRTFSLDDINRFNVLFTAGVHYGISQKIGVEIRGNYGLTELVKNSYLNQSSENNNFKAVQLGLSWSLGKKR